jgi:cytochrome c-type biogenesis protein CcmE
MTKGLVISIIVAALAMTGMLAAFLTSASPYVTIAEARKLKADNLHIVGDLDKSTLTTRLQEGEVRFAMTDEKGARMNVIYKGSAPANMGEATKVVVIGGFRGDEFLARNILVKCPSKYQGKKA